MSSPTNTKTVRVSLETHTQLTALADKLNGTVDDAVQWLFLRENLVRVPIAEERKPHWQQAATEAGLPLPEFIAAVTDAAVIYGTDRGTMLLAWNHVKEIRGLVRQMHAIAMRAADQ